MFLLIDGVHGLKNTEETDNSIKTLIQLKMNKRLQALTYFSIVCTINPCNNRFSLNIVVN